jgi:hypothetical protein
MRDGFEIECVRGSVWCRMLCLALSLGDDGVLYSSPSVCLTLLVCCVGLVGGGGQKASFPFAECDCPLFVGGPPECELGGCPGRVGSGCVVLSVSAE